MDVSVTSIAAETSFTRGNVDAIMKSGQIWIAGCQAISQTMATSAQGRVDHAMATWKAMAGVASWKDAVEVQRGFIRSSCANGFADTSSLATASIKLVEQAMLPIKHRLMIVAGHPAPPVT